MPALATPSTPETDLLPVLVIIKEYDVKPPCFKSKAWTSQARNRAELAARSRAIKICRHECDRRVLCAAWAFAMEDAWVWAGFTEDERRALHETHPNMIGELLMKVRALINTTDGLGGSMRPGQERDVPDRVGQMLVSKGYAEALDVVEQLDKAKFNLVADLPSPAPVEIPEIDADTIVDEEMGVEPPEDEDDSPWPDQD